jgi:hypothetical protein
MFGEELKPMPAHSDDEIRSLINIALGVRMAELSCKYICLLDEEAQIIANKYK